MRLGITLPNMDAQGNLLDASAIFERARMIEAAGFDGIWMPDHLPIPGEVGRDRPDPLMYLAVASVATARVELGTCIFAVPIRTKYDVAQRVFSLETLAPGRVTIGVGTGSQEHEYEGAGLDWADRFKLLRGHMTAIRATFDGELHEPMQTPAGGLGAPSQFPTWPQRSGRPRFVLGAWVSERQMRRAVDEYDGWMSSAGPGIQYGGGKKVLSEGIKRYRDFGGRRALVSTVSIDLSAPTTSQVDEGGPFNLRCSPDAAMERLAYLEQLGYDDVILWPIAFTPRAADGPGGPPKYDYTMDDLEQWRSLLKRDDRSYSAV